MSNTAADTQKKLASYVIGFITSILLCVAAYVITTQKLFDTEVLYVALSVIAFALIFVQIFCFLRLNASAAERHWNMIALIFTIIVIMIVVTGSLWIMYNLNYFMMH